MDISLRFVFFFVLLNSLYDICNGTLAWDIIFQNGCSTFLYREVFEKFGAKIYLVNSAGVECKSRLPIEKLFF